MYWDWVGLVIKAEFVLIEWRDIYKDRSLTLINPLELSIIRILATVYAYFILVCGI